MTPQTQDDGSAAERDGPPVGEAASPSSAAERLQLLGRLAGGVAHDFNNLLTVILTCLDQANALLPPDAAARTELDAARTAARAGARLVAQLLTRGQPRVPSHLSLNAVVRETTGLLARAVGEKVVLEVDLAEDLWPVRADPAEVWQLLINLALNAHDAMPAGGSLRLRTFNAPAGPAPEVRPRLPAGSYVVLQVSDSGSGIDAATQRRLFEPFFTTKGAGGTGLGLATVARIVAGAGGGIGVDSQPGRGATFAVYLPRARS